MTEPSQALQIWHSTTLVAGITGTMHHLSIYCDILRPATKTLATLGIKVQNLRELAV